MVTIAFRGTAAAAHERREAHPVAPTDLSSRLPRLVLASRSPRRRQLLSEHGLAHDAVPMLVDDALLAPGPVPAEQWVVALAYLKAAAGADPLRASGGTRPALVLGADTVCVKDGRVLGQPRDAADAAQMLRLLQDGWHEVVTGVALLRTDDLAWRSLLVDRATVRVGHLGEERIAQYVASGQWMGKAGGYNLGERLEAGWPIEYDGDPTTIVGLPMRALVARLESLFSGAG